MSFITREDGERFVIPSYRDVLSVKKGNLLKKEVLLLSENYGGYATIIKKNPQQFEVAFSPDPGYLLGETVWQYFKRPLDLIYCEVLPNTAEAILVIVKSGSVFLDGSFPIDSISEELVVFLTQQNNFDIYVNGDVPISQTPEEGKFAFDVSQVKSFNVLPEPAFPKLPKLRAFQLQLVDTALKAQGIGVFPVKPVLVSGIIVGLIWMGWNYLTTHKKELPVVVITAVSPYQNYINALTSPAPSQEIKMLAEQVTLFFSIPGWVPDSLDYSDGKISVGVKSLGASTDTLLAWAQQNKYQLEARQQGFFLTSTATLSNRMAPRDINKLDEVIASLVDRLALVLPGNNLDVTSVTQKGGYRESKMTLTITNISDSTFDLIGQQLNDLPLVLTKANIKFSNGLLSGTITLSALGN